MQDVLGDSPEVLLFADEMVASINRVNYNQNNSLNAMAGAPVTSSMWTLYRISQLGNSPPAGVDVAADGPC